MQRFHVEIETEGNGDIVDVSRVLHRDHARELDGSGIVHLFVVGSTAALTTVEYEPGLVKNDLPAAMQRLAPDDLDYHHELTWHDDNGHSHIRSALLGASVSVPFENGRLLTGQYQQIVLCDFDTRPRRRTVIASVLR